MATNGHAPSSNAEFLQEVFKNVAPGETPWILSKAEIDDGNWTGRPVNGKTPESRSYNNYTSISTYREEGGEYKRRKANFAGTHVVVLDDVNLGSLILPPSYVVETSPGKHQVGYILEKPERNMAAVDALMSELAQQKLIPVDKSGNNAVRVVRLPFGANTKYPGSPECKLVEWTGKRYSFSEVVGTFNVNAPDSFSPPEIKSPASKLERFSEIINEVLRGENYHDGLNRIGARMITNGAHRDDVVEVLRSLMYAARDHETNHHRWQTRFDDIERSVDTAVAKFKKEEIAETTEDLTKVESTFSDYKPIEWVLDGFLAWGITVMAGAPGVGKTSHIVSLAMLVAHLCEPDHPMRPTLGRKVIYVTEDAIQVENILIAACRLNGVDPKEVARGIHIYEARKMPAAAVAMLVAQKIRDMSVTHSSGFAIRPLTILDTSSSVFAMEDENSNAEGSKVIAEVKQILDGAPLWLVAHTPKGLARKDVDDLTVRGAGAFEGDANATAFFFKEEGVEEIRFMKLAKIRYTPEFKELMFSGAVDTSVVHTPWGVDQVVQVRVSYPERSSKEERDVQKEIAKTTAKEENNQETVDAILKFLGSNGPASKTTIKKNVTGKNDTIGAIIATLIGSGALEIVGAGPKQVVRLSDQPM